MLVQATFENILSFRDETTFSMIAGEGAAANPEWTRPGPNGLRLLRVAGVYGANAAGKSNLVKALAQVRKLLLDGRRPDTPIGLAPFRLDDSGSRPSRAQLDLFLDGALWSVVIHFDAAQIIEEELWKSSPAEPDVRLFQRKTAADGRCELTLSDEVALDAEQRQFLAFVARGTRPNQPFIAELRERNAEVFTEVSAWLSGQVVTLNATTDLRVQWAKMASRNVDYLGFLGHTLEITGTGIQELQVKVDVPVGAISTEPSIDEITSALKDDNHKKYFSFVQGPSGEALLEGEQSDGTLRLLDIASLLFLAKQPKGYCLLIDELDRALHALASRRILQQFLELSASHDHQLIFTTHDTSLLDHRLLPPEAIWFAEKDERGATSLYSLAEFKPEQLEALEGTWERGYLQGRFGAIPFVSDPQRLGWTREG